MANVYGVKFTTVRELKHPVSFDGEGRPTKFETQRISGKEGTLNVLAADPQDAGNIAQAHLKTDGVMEVNIHLVQELAKNVITAAPSFDINIAAADAAEAIVKSNIGQSIAPAAEPDITMQLQADATKAQERTDESAPGV